MMMICFCGMVNQRKVYSLNSSRDHCQRSSASWISNMPRAGFEPVQNLSSGFVEWNCAVVITTTPPGVFPSTLSYYCICVPNWVCKRLKTFSHAEDMKKLAGGLQSTVSPRRGPGQSPGEGPRGEASGSSMYLGFENLLL